VSQADCVEVCPYEVFTVTTLPVEQRKGLTFLGRLKGRAHGWQQALTPNAERRDLPRLRPVRDGLPGARHHPGPSLSRFPTRHPHQGKKAPLGAFFVRPPVRSPVEPRNSGAVSLDVGAACDIWHFKYHIKNRAKVFSRTSRDRL